MIHLTQIIPWLAVAVALMLGILLYRAFNNHSRKLARSRTQPRSAYIWKDDRYSK